MRSCVGPRPHVDLFAQGARTRRRRRTGALRRGARRQAGVVHDRRGRRRVERARPARRGRARSRRGCSSSTAACSCPDRSRGSPSWPTGECCSSTAPWIATGRAAWRATSRRPSRSTRCGRTSRRCAIPEFTVKLRNASDLFCYAVVHPSRVPDGFVDDLTAWAAERGWRTSMQGRKLYWVPDAAAQEHGRARGGRASRRRLRARRRRLVARRRSVARRRPRHPPAARRALRPGLDGADRDDDGRERNRRGRRDRALVQRGCSIGCAGLTIGRDALSAFVQPA